MARMIPAAYRPDTPRGEALLFDKLERDPETDGWVVLHSLHLSAHVRKVGSEIDLLVLVPDLGILGIEVKGSNVKRTDNGWDYGYEQSSESPFFQAESAVRSLRKKYLEQKMPDAKKLLFWHAVAFTRIDFSEESSEWFPWEIMDATLIRRRQISGVIKNILQRAHDHQSETLNSRAWYENKSSRPSPSQIDRIVHLLRPNFDKVTNPRHDLKDAEEALLELTEQQYSTLDAVQDNKRVLVRGLAGTGKTLLAMEAAKREASRGKRVLLLCFNRYLGDWMRREMVGGEWDVTVKTFHGFLQSLLPNSEQDALKDSDYWKIKLPSLAVEALLSDNSGFLGYDVLIVDEAQDLICNSYLDVFDLVLNGGIASGEWTFFGDFEKQAIYTSDLGLDAEEQLNILESRSRNFSNYRLTENCRNSGPIARMISVICQLSPDYTKIPKDLEGSRWDAIYWASPDEQWNRLDDAVRALRGDKYKSSEIVVLSPFGAGKSCASTHPQGKYTPYIFSSSEQGKGVCYSSIHAFKGLESLAVIVTDIVSLKDNYEALLYIAVSRAKLRLVLLVEESVKADLVKIILEE